MKAMGYSVWKMLMYKRITALDNIQKWGNRRGRNQTNARGSCDR